MVSFNDFKEGIQGAVVSNLISGVSKNCPEPGVSIVKIPVEAQQDFLKKASENIPPLPGQLIGATKPWALPELKDGKLFLYDFARKGGVSGFKPIYHKKPNWAFYFDGEDFKYELLVGKMFAPMKSARITYINKFLSLLEGGSTGSSQPVKEVSENVEDAPTPHEVAAVDSTDKVSQQDWKDYFQLVNGREPTLDEFTAAKNNGEFE